MVSNIFHQQKWEDDGTMTIKFQSSGLPRGGRPQGHDLESELQVRKMRQSFGNFSGIGTLKLGAQKRHLAVYSLFHWKILLGK